MVEMTSISALLSLAKVVTCRLNREQEDGSGFCSELLPVRFRVKSSRRRTGAFLMADVR